MSSTPKASLEDFPAESPGNMSSSAAAADVPQLTELQKRQFRESGYLALERITTDEDVAVIRAVVKAMFKAKTGYEEGMLFNMVGDEENPDAPSLPQIVRPHHFAGNLTETLFYQNAFALSRELLGPKACFHFDHVLMKPAINGPETPWHQDEAFGPPTLDCNQISFWMPLQPVDRLNGCMKFVPSIYLDELLTHRPLNDDPKVHALECPQDFDPQQVVECPLPLGGCTLHGGRTLHAAGPNRSNEPRYAYVLVFHVPATPAPELESFPWNEKKKTARMKRQNEWRLRGEVPSTLWHKLRKAKPRDYWGIFLRLSLKVRTYLSRRH